MKPLHYLTLVLLLLALVIALVPQNTTRPYKLTAEQLLTEIRTGTQFVSPDEVADRIIKKDPSLQLIDVRNPREFDVFSLPGAINIPLQDILSEKNTDLLNQGTKMNIFYSNGSTEANEAWLLTRQIGYQNNYVLQGGLNYWMETIVNPQKPGTLPANDEMARYDFRKAASMALGGGSLTPVTTAPATDAGKATPGVVPVKKKKKASGGC
ncbi:MAG TPA: rhodanese-like domain-containing protein [Bacteroidales bacterium]|nr:rhodanese-like domain-containing protein [Bacteroidales bacterium]